MEPPLNRVELSPRDQIEGVEPHWRTWNIIGERRTSSANVDHQQTWNIGECGTSLANVKHHWRMWNFISEHYVDQINTIKPNQLVADQLVADYSGTIAQQDIDSDRRSGGVCGYVPLPRTSDRQVVA